MQAEWLADARARILRLAGIAQRKSVLDLGSGYGIITQELRRRTSGNVFALDQSLSAISGIQPCVCADASKLPFRDTSFDCVFSQNLLLWISSAEVVVEGVHRVLKSHGVWVLFEPDFGGMIEHPAEIESKDIWIASLLRAGADPLIGRKLPALLQKAGFRVTTEFLPRLEKASSNRLDFLSELDLTDPEKERLNQIRNACQDRDSISHLPYFLIIAERP